MSTSHSYAHQVLVVDDDPLFRKMLVTILQREGLRVLEAENGRQAVDIALAQQPQLVLMDAHMPELDGFAACRQIKDAIDHPGTQVLMVTASNDEDLIEKAFAAGASDYITKPINWTLFKHRVRHELAMSSTFLAMQNSEHRFRVLFEQAPVAYAVLDVQGVLQDFNPAMTRLVDTPLSRGENLSTLLCQACRPRFEQLLHRLSKDPSTPVQETYQLCPSKGRHLYIQLTAQATRSVSSGQPEILTILEDITEQQRATQKLKKMAETDALTGLLNRRSFESALHALLSHHRATDADAALLMLDIDHFKRINDTWGHPVGDEVLIHLGRLLRQALHREQDSVYRLGGEEFAILLPDTTVNGACHVAERLRQVVERSPAETAQGAIPFTVSIGVAMLAQQPTTGDLADQWINAADQALYQAKQKGRNRVEPCASQHIA